MSEEAVKRTSEDGEQPTKRQREDETSEAPPAKVPAAKEATAPKETVDRSKRCPLLLRMFPKPGGHNHIHEYNNRKSTMPSNELSIHTWMDADLRELADLVKQTQSVARHKDATMEFALVFPDKRGNNVMRVVGTVHSTQPGQDDSKTLKLIKFQTGDYMDVSIRTPSLRSSTSGRDDARRNGSSRGLPSRRK